MGAQGWTNIVAMTAVCPGGGPSHIKTGTLGTLIYASGGAAVLSEFGVPWLVTAAAALGIISFETTTLCASDPPAMPTWTDADTFALYTADPGAAGHTARDKITQMIGNLVWYQACECITGPQPAPPAPPADPGGTAIIGPAPAPTSACASSHLDNSVTAYCGGNNNAALIFGFVDLNGRNVTASRLTVRRYNSTGAGFPATGNLQWWDANAPVRQDMFPTVVGDGTTVYQLSGAPAGATRVTAAVNGTGSGCANFESTLELFCNGEQPGGSQGACCQPDPSTQTTLDAILQMVTLIQRQHVPFATISGGSHVGITGNGQFPVQGILGIKVVLTTTPARLGVVSGNPDDLYDAGWINVGTADGWGPRRWIGSSPMIVRPIEPDVTLVGYSIPTDVVVTITE